MSLSEHALLLCAIFGAIAFIGYLLIYLLAKVQKMHRNQFEMGLAQLGIATLILGLIAMSIIAPRKANAFQQRICTCGAGKNDAKMLLKDNQFAVVAVLDEVQTQTLTVLSPQNYDLDVARFDQVVPTVPKTRHLLQDETQPSPLYLKFLAKIVFNSTEQNPPSTIFASFDISKTQCPVSIEVGGEYIIAFSSADIEEYFLELNTCGSIALIIPHSQSLEAQLKFQFLVPNTTPEDTLDF